MKKRPSRFGVLLAVFVLAADCGSRQGKQLRIAWDQAMSGPDDITLLRFAVYINSERYALPQAVCSAPQNGVASCESPLPPLAPGSYQLEMVSYRLPNYVDSPKAPVVELVVREE
jgi:hypothetical protein